jgi:transposase
MMKKKDTKKKAKSPVNTEATSSLPVLYPNTAGIDIGGKSHFVAVPVDRDANPVREFSSFTSDLIRIAEWLKACNIQTVIMESTGVFWMPLFEILETRGFEVQLVNSRHLKNVSAHKTDVLDCQWLQQLGTYGLLRGAVRPPDAIVVLRSYVRQRDTLIKCAADHVQHMQKAMVQMNIQLQFVIADITGKTGMAIMRNIAAGKTDPKQLAKLRDEGCHNSEEVIAEALNGNYRQEHVFALRQALSLYDFYLSKVYECDCQIETLMKKFESKCDSERMKLLSERWNETKKRTIKKHRFPFDLREELCRMTGVDLCQIPSIGASTALTVFSEIGLDVSRWPSAKHFASWLGLCPGTKISGGKRLSGKTKRCKNRLAIALRIAANTLSRSQCAYGAFLRRMKARLDSPKAITAMAHKLAKMIYWMLKHGSDFVEKGVEYYEAKYRARQEASLKKKAQQLGYALVPLTA